MKKIFTLFAVAVMAFAAQAAELTVCEAEMAYQTLPVYGYWYDAQGISQMIYPADMLQEMNGGKINTITFYTPAAQWGDDFSDYTVAFSGGNIQLSLKEVDQVGFVGTEGEFELVSGATVVANTVPATGDLYLTFVLDEPFEYNGGNLLVEAAWNGEGTWGRTYFVAVDELDYTPCYYGFDYYGDWSEALCDYLPMATFTYEAGETPVEPTEKTDAPSSQKENYVYNDGNMYYNAYHVTLIPTEESEIWYRVGVLVDGDYVYGDWMLYTDVLTFDDEGTYMVEAYAIAPNKTESDHIWDGFTVSKLVDVEEILAGKAVAGVRYFNMAGQEMQQANGLTIVVTTYTDGTTSTVKVMK